MIKEMSSLWQAVGGGVPGSCCHLLSLGVLENDAVQDCVPPITVYNMEQQATAVFWEEKLAEDRLVLCSGLQVTILEKLVTSILLRGFFKKFPHFFIFNRVNESAEKKNPRIYNIILVGFSQSSASSF